MPHAKDRLGEPIPADTPHAVSVTLPTWRSNVGYEEAEDWVVSRMTTGYPRFFVNKKISSLADLLVQKHGIPGEQAMLFPTATAAQACLAFIESHSETATGTRCRLVTFVPSNGEAQGFMPDLLVFSAVFFPSTCFKAAKTFWQHTGEGMSSRRADYLRDHYERGSVNVQDSTCDISRQRKGPRRYRKEASEAPTLNSETSTELTNGASHSDSTDADRFVEERFGRNLTLARANDAKTAIRRRIAGSLTTDEDLDKALHRQHDDSRIRKVSGFSPEDVYLYPCGMNSIYMTHLRLLASDPSRSLKAICFGFPYIDTLKVLEKFGPGCLFYGHGTDEDLDDLEARLRKGERFLSLFCEFPSNPLLRCPNLRRIRDLADQYDFAVVVDETIGNFLNVSILPLADVMVSSLTKIFSGDSNVMGGCAIYNPQSRYYDRLRNAVEYVDTYWPEDAVVMERNSRDFVPRIDRINKNAEAICDLLATHPRVKNIYYPKVNPSKVYYDERRNPNGGYGGLLSAVFHSTEEAALFYDNLDTEKGPSLGTNFTLASPFVLLAHYTELDWAAQYGVDKNLIRFSVGLEDTDGLVQKVQRALDALSRQAALGA